MKEVNKSKFSCNERVSEWPLKYFSFANSSVSFLLDSLSPFRYWYTFLRSFFSGGMKIFKVPETMSWSLSLSGEWTSWNWPGRVVRIKSIVFFSRVGKCTICSKPWSFIMSINICPSDWLNVEPDLLSLSGQSISLKLKSPRTWTEGSFLPYDESCCDQAVL